MHEEKMKKYINIFAMLSFMMALWQGSGLEKSAESQ